MTDLNIFYDMKLDTKEKATMASVDSSASAPVYFNVPITFYYKTFKKTERTREGRDRPAKI